MERVAHAGTADIPRIVDMVDALRTSVSGPIGVDREWTARTVAQLMASPSACVFVTATGFIAGLLQPTVISPALVAKELGWWSGDRRDGIRLLRAFEVWAGERGATLLQLSTAPDGPDLTRLGYSRAELAWVR